MISFGGKKRIKIILRTTPSLENTLGLVKKYETLPKEDSLDSLLFSVQEGFNLGLIPKLTFDGTSGSYFLQNKFRKNVVRSDSFVISLSKSLIRQSLSHLMKNHLPRIIQKDMSINLEVQDLGIFMGYI